MTIQDHYIRKTLALDAISELVYNHNNGLDFTQKRLATELQKSLYYQMHGLKKMINKDPKKNDTPIV